MVHSVRVSWVCALVLSLSAVACGGDDDDDAAGASGKGGGSAGTSGKGSAGSAGGGGEDRFGTDPKRNDVTAGTICERVATILCAGEEKCCESESRSFDDCKSASVKSCMNNLMLDTIAKDARVGFDAAGASTAVAMLETRAKACDPKVTSWAASREGFGQALDGTLAAGADCEPMNGRDANQTELLTALASCQAAGDLACLGVGDEWKCTARAAKGGKCSIDANCADGLFCESMTDDFDGSGTCTDRKAGGTNCNEDSECTSYICVSGKCAADTDVQAAYCLE